MRVIGAARKKNVMALAVTVKKDRLAWSFKRDVTKAFLFRFPR